MALRAPAHLSPASKKLWRTVAMDYFNQVGEDVPLLILTTMCECRDLADEARRVIAKEGISVPTADGGVKTNPACAVLRDARSQMIRCAAELGLDPDGP